LHPEDNSSLGSTGLHSANNVPGSTDHEETPSSKLKDVIGHARFYRWHQARRLKTAEIGCYCRFN
jgi:hypothetical protein